MFAIARIAFFVLTVLFVSACGRTAHSAAKTTVSNETQAAQERTKKKTNDDVNAAMSLTVGQNNSSAATGHTTL